MTSVRCGFNSGLQGDSKSLGTRTWDGWAVSFSRTRHGCNAPIIFEPLSTRMTQPVDALWLALLAGQYAAFPSRRSGGTGRGQERMGPGSLHHWPCRFGHSFANRNCRRISTSPTAARASVTFRCSCARCDHERPLCPDVIPRTQSSRSLFCSTTADDVATFFAINAQAERPSCTSLSRFFLLSRFVPAVCHAAILAGMNIARQFVSVTIASLAIIDELHACLGNAGSGVAHRV